MAWNRSATPTTKHTCGGPVFGQKTPGCPRCDELLAGAAPVKWAHTQREEDRRLVADILAHDCRVRGCGPVCTFGDW